MIREAHPCTLVGFFHSAGDASFATVQGAVNDAQLD